MQVNESIQLMVRRAIVCLSEGIMRAVLLQYRQRCTPCVPSQCRITVEHNFILDSTVTYHQLRMLVLNNPGRMVELSCGVCHHMRAVQGKPNIIFEPDIKFSIATQGTYMNAWTSLQAEMFLRAHAEGIGTSTWGYD